MKKVPILYALCITLSTEQPASNLASAVDCAVRRGEDDAK